MSVDSGTEFIRVRGARTHNLRGIDVDIPRNQLVVVTGLSGSGKSSLAFDTIHAEGRRRYLETLSPQMRFHLEKWPRPDFDELTGLPPTLAIEQVAAPPRPRSLVATITELHDFLRLWYARVGMLYCPRCNLPVCQQSIDEIVSRIVSIEAGRKVMVLAPLVRKRKGAHTDVFEKIARLGLIRARVDGELIDVAQPPALAKSKFHSIDAVVDRIIVKSGLETRLRESTELAVRISEGGCLVAEQTESGWNERLYSTRLSCGECGTSYPPVEPRTFSMHSPYGACAECDGLGVNATGEVCPACQGERLSAAGRNVKWRDQSLPKLLALTVRDARERLEPLSASDENADVTPQVLDELYRRVFPEIVRRLQFLDQVGLGYLQLDRPASTLSGGELQRARLAQALGGGPVGACYVLDEPTTGLHPRDTRRLLDTLRGLRDRGTSLVVVEHDLDVIRAADHVIDLGPGAGREGGCIVGQGTPEELSRDHNSPTGRELIQQSLPDARAPVASDSRRVVLHNARLRNLKDLTVEFPLGQLVCVTGVSGSGKSTLVMEALVPLVRQEIAAREFPGQQRQYARTDQLPAELGSVSGVDSLGRIVVVDQSPLGLSGRGNPATAAGLWDEVRRFFARTREARLRGFTARRFSWNAPGGRCETCRGHGVRRLAMGFLPDVLIECGECRGRRFNPATLQPRFRGKTIADLLDLRIDEAVEFFDGFASLRDKLRVLSEIGLGYLTLGQPAPTLSGGEAQRLKLGRELLLPKDSVQSTLFVLDEPTTGLHVLDVDRLLGVFRRLTSLGHTLLVIEHHLRVIQHADHVIDLGPEAGDAGGLIVAAGTPLEISRSQPSRTGAALRGEF